MATSRLENDDCGRNNERRQQSLILDISDLIEFNSPNGDMNFYPQYNADLNFRATELGFNDVLHFCMSFPKRFIIHSNELIYLNCGERHQSEAQMMEKAMDQIVQELKAGPSYTSQPGTNIHDYDLLDPTMEYFNPLPPPIQYSIVKGETQSIAPTKKVDFVHFKFTHDGKTRRFTFPRDDSNLIGLVKQKVHTIMGASKTFLYWNDDESLIVLECYDDMCAAIDFAERSKKPPCLVIEATMQEQAEEEMKFDDLPVDEKKAIYKPEIVIDRVVSRDDSSAAFNDFAFVCDSCDTFLAPSNGGRYKCVVCDNYDLCANCVSKGVHDNHALIRLMNGETIVPLSDGKGGIKQVQVMDTPRCTPSFAVLQNYDKPVKMFEPKELEVRKQTTWEKVQETMEKQRASYEKQKVLLILTDDEPNGSKRLKSMIKESIMKEEVISQKTEEQKRREQNLKNALKHPFDRMQAEDEEVWRILKKERELHENKSFGERLMREEEIEEKRRIDEEMKKLSQREEIIRLEMEQMKIEKALMELRMRFKESFTEEVKQNQKDEHKELWSEYEMWKEKTNEEKKGKDNAERKISDAANNEQAREEETDQQRDRTSFSSDGSDLEFIEMIHESESVLESMQMIQKKMDQLLLEPATESAASAADPISIAVDETVPVPPPSPSPDYEMPFEPAPLIMSTEQYEVYISLCDTGIFDDFDRMAQVCRSAANIEQAIDMMLDDPAPILINPAEYI